MRRDFCSTVYIFHEDKVLLHLHPKFQKYLPAGGHLEENETPVETALREVKEETDLDILLIQEDETLLTYSHAKSIERPFLCLLENIEKPDKHQHIDFIYLAKPIENKKPKAPFEYFSLSDAEKIYEEGMMFEDVIFVIRKVLLEKKHLLIDKALA